MTDQIMKELGEIKGLLTGVKEQQDRLDETVTRLDDRLRTVEKAGALTGAVSGAVMAVAVGFLQSVLGKGS